MRLLITLPLRLHPGELSCVFPSSSRPPYNLTDSSGRRRTHLNPVRIFIYSRLLVWVAEDPASYRGQPLQKCFQSSPSTWETRGRPSFSRMMLSEARRAATRKMGKHLNQEAVAL